MKQEKFDDNGMTFGLPVRFIYKDVETEKVRTEDVPYTESYKIIEGKKEGNSMLQLPKAGWIESKAIKKFYSIIPLRSMQYKPSCIKKGKSILDISEEDFKKFLGDEIIRLHDRTEITGIPDPRSRIYPIILNQKTHQQRIDMYLKNSSGNIK